MDLGSAPGGWVQAAREIVGSKGFVLGVDLKQMEAFAQHNVRTMIGDISEPETLKQIAEQLPRKADSIISDASPNISGVWEVDHACQIDLADQALNIALETLKPAGNFFVKIFQGDLLDDFVKRVRQHFEVVDVIKPKASRARSSEMYVLARRLRKTAE